MGNVSVARAVEGLVAGMQRDNPEFAQAARVKAAWERIVDERLARHIVSVYVVPQLRGREVVVYVDSSMHVADFTMQVELLRLKLNMELARMAEGGQDGEGPLQVEKLCFRLSGEAYRKQPRPAGAGDDVRKMRAAEQAIEPVPLSAEEFAEVEHSVEGLEDERLAAVIRSAARANLEWQKGQQQHPPA